MTHLTSPLLVLLCIACFVQQAISQIDRNAKIQVEETGINFPCCSETQMDIHPNLMDFSSKPGRVMISTLHDDLYYTDYQQEDGKVIIEVHLPEEQAGEIVYFRVTDPDPDDLSSYETNNDSGDNVGGPGQLDKTMVEAEEEEVDDETKAVARCTLTITNQYSGDNYQVEASCSDDFSTYVATPVLVAWKRVYVEYDEMLRKGASLIDITTYINFNDNFPDILPVDDNSDFSIGDKIIVFSPDGIEFEATVEDTPGSNAITVIGTGGPFNLLKFWGVMIDGEDETFSIPLNLIEGGFGKLTDGGDGGAFVEFIPVQIGNEITPKYTQFPNDPSEVSGYVGTWRTSSNIGPPHYNDNRFHIIASSDIENAASRGATVEPLNYTLLFEDNFVNPQGTFPQDKIPLAMAETLVHELGHQFDILVGTFPHVHEFPPMPGDPPLDPEYNNHEGTDRGVMSYARDFIDGIAEFYLGCIYHIRNHEDPED